MANSTIANYYQVTLEQMDACDRIQDLTHRQIFYIVKSASQAGVEYKVEFNKQHRVLQCNCAAGKEGNNCWHKRAALAAEQEYQAEHHRAVRIEQTRRIEGTAEYQQEQAQHTAYTAQINLTR